MARLKKAKYAIRNSYLLKTVRGDTASRDLNFLGHIALARQSSESRIGNFLGDFVKGRPEYFADAFSPEVFDGILMHRSIDAFTDSHATFSAARAALAPERQRYAGIVVDIIYDHFLSLQWQQWMKTVEKKEFVGKFYADLQKWPIPSPPKVSPLFREISNRMIEQDWLNAYSTLEGMDLTFSRVSHRSHHLKTIAGCGEDLRKNYEIFRTCFEAFIPDALTFAENWHETHPLT